MLKHLGFSDKNAIEQFGFLMGIKKGSDITWRSEFDATAPIIKDFSETESFSLV